MIIKLRTARKQIQKYIYEEHGAKMKARELLQWALVYNSKLNIPKFCAHDFINISNMPNIVYNEACSIKITKVDGIHLCIKT